MLTKCRSRKSLREYISHIVTSRNVFELVRSLGEFSSQVVISNVDMFRSLTDTTAFGKFDRTLVIDTNDRSIQAVVVDHRLTGCRTEMGVWLHRHSTGIGSRHVETVQECVDVGALAEG